MKYTELPRFPVALLIAFLLFAAAAFADEETEHYRNDEIGFSLEIPSSWFLLDGGANDGVIIASDPDFRDARTDNGAAIGIVLLDDALKAVDKSQKTMILQKLWNETVVGMDEDVSGPNSIMLGELESLWGSFENTQEDFSAIIYLSSGFGKAYMVLAVIHPSSELEEKHRPILDKMVETLVFFP